MLSNITYDVYHKMLNDLGIYKTWTSILDYLRTGDDIPYFLDAYRLSDLYENGLAFLSKDEKKALGKYFTPPDVSSLLASFFEKQKGEEICDVACGTGNLMLSYLKLLPHEKARDLLLKGKVHLYDLDECALKIAVYRLGLAYGHEVEDKIDVVAEDFLDQNLQLPALAKVIANPPYSRITSIPPNWSHTEIVQESLELYAAFFEKIVKNSVSSVIISPFSFIGAEKFYNLRLLLNNYNGKIFAFDNVPGNIFKGKKHGIFNSNTANSVRAAITVTENLKGRSGYRVSPLIRFKTHERDRILDGNVLEELLPKRYQCIDLLNDKYYKCFRDLEEIFLEWKRQSTRTFAELMSKDETPYSLCVPTTCRYYLCATKKELQRSGKYQLYFKDEDAYDTAYCFLNSSFAYWHWRLYDGGITYSMSLLKSMPILDEPLLVPYKDKLHDLCVRTLSREEECTVYKKNASELQENIKFPKEVRDDFNKLLLNVMHLDENVAIFDRIHQNSLFGPDYD